MTKKMLVVYYSWSNGNTEGIARQLARACDADIERIETSVPYPTDYDTMVEQGKREVEAGFKPTIECLAHDPADYDVIAVGTPTWWYTMAPAVATFFSEHNWKGKTVVPFMTNGGWPGHVIRDMKNACTGAKIACEMQVKFDSNGGDHLETPEANIDAWARDVKALL